MASWILEEKSVHKHWRVISFSQYPQFILAAMSLIAIFFYIAVSLRNYTNLRTGMDLTIFDQAIRSFSHFQMGYSLFKGANFPIFGDHFHPIILTMVPLYWVWDNPRMLLIAQAVAIGWAGWLLGRLALRRLTPSAALAATFACFSGFGLQWAVVSDFHEYSLGAPLLVFAVGAFIEKHWNACWILSACLLLVKEDMGFLVGGIALAMIIRRKTEWGITLGLLSIAWTALATLVIIPAFNPLHTYSYLGQTSTISTYGVPFTIHTAFVIALAVGLVVARSPLFFAFIVPFIPRAINTKYQYWGQMDQYNLLPTILVCLAFIDAWPLICSWKPRNIALRWAKALWKNLTIPMMLAMSIISIVNGPIKGWLTYTLPPGYLESFTHAASLIPDDANVATNDYFGSHFTTRANVSSWQSPYLDTDNKPVTPDWIVLNLLYPDDKKFLGNPTANGVHYKVIYNYYSIAVLQRT